MTASVDRSVLRSVLRRRRRLRAGLTQLLFVLVGLGLGLAVPGITRGPETPARPVVDMLLATGLGVLGGIAVIFSLLFLVVQWAATTFTPRLTLFRDAPIVWRTFAFAVGQAAFCLTATLAIGSRPEVSVAVPVIAGLLLFTMLALLRQLQLRAFAAIQLAPVLNSITERGRAILDALYPRVADPTTPPTMTPLPPLRSTVTWPKAPAVLQQIDMNLLLTTAQAANAVIVLREIPGTTLQHGTALADVHDGELPASAVLDCLVTGDERTFDQDPVLAFRLLADIALRALSPAVNDPATAVQALDSMEDLLNRSSGARTGLRHVTDRAGAVRVVIRLPGWEDFLRTGLDDVIPAAMNSPMALIRTRTLLEHLRSRGDAHSHPLLTRRLAWVEEELAGRFPQLWQETAEDPPASG
ncbi:DUF2254 family protein [Streptomyces sp. NPDC057136]|uniref:DUF2254 family protein n=1 Tax=Streptomyces sp. NPDC057136 TaxID=3346029 RepID=UPI00362C8F3B